MLSSAMKNDPHTAWKIINELKMIHYLQMRRKNNNRNQWLTHFRDLLHSNKNQLYNDRQNTIKKNFFNMKTPVKMVL